MNIWAKLISGSAKRKTRLHDEAGNIVSLSRLCRNGPKALVGCVLRVVFGFVQKVPWISFDARETIECSLSPSSRVLEFGAGYSTVWLAQRCRFVLSVEHDAQWCQRVLELIKFAPDGRCSIKLCHTHDEYIRRLSPQEVGGGFHLIVIDGIWRDDAMENALPYLSEGGRIYIDNSDRDDGGQDGIGGNMNRARAIALRFAADHGYRVSTFTDFAPGQFFVQQGMLLEKDVPPEISG